MASGSGALGKGIGKGLGRGLDALIRDTGIAQTSPSAQMLSIESIVPNPTQPRRYFAEEALNELADSIRSQGVLQPLLVRPSESSGLYTIVAGERRWRASQLAGLTEVPVLIRTLSDMETLAAALIENLQREDLSALEESFGLQRLKDEFNLSQEELATRLGKSRSAIANSLRLLSLPEVFYADLAEGRLSAGHARALLAITDPTAQLELHDRILAEGLSVREAEGLAAVWKSTGSLCLVHESTKGTAEDKNSALELALNRFAAEDIDISAQEDSTPLQASEIIDNQQTDTMQSYEQNRSTIKPQSAILMEIQARITSVLRLPVKVTGKDTKGKISLSYSSRAELNALLRRLALPEDAAFSGLELLAPFRDTSRQDSSIQTDSSEVNSGEFDFNPFIVDAGEAISLGDRILSEAEALGEALPLEETPEAYMRLVEKHTDQQIRKTTSEVVSEAVSVAEQFLSKPIAVAQPSESTPQAKNIEAENE